MIAPEMNVVLRVGRLVSLLLLGAVILLTAPISAQAQTSQPSIQDQVLNNLRQSPVGEHTLDALNLPEDYLRRVADRILRNSYEQQFRIVVPDGASATSAPSAANPPPIAGLENIAVPSASIWPPLVGAAMAVCAVAALVIAIQALKARR